MKVSATGPQQAGSEPNASKHPFFLAPDPLTLRVPRWIFMSAKLRTHRSRCNFGRRATSGVPLLPALASQAIVKNPWRMRAARNDGRKSLALEAFSIISMSEWN